MNAAVRAVVRRVTPSGVEVTGIRRGYFGLLGREFQPLGPDSVHDIIHRGGTMLLTVRCEEFLNPGGAEGRGPQPARGGGGWPDLCGR